VTAAAVVSSLRARPEIIRLWNGAQPFISVRVEMPEVWDTVRIETPPTEAVLAIKVRALDVLFPDHGDADDFVMKLNGFEVRDEHGSIGHVGATNGSTFLLTFRRRRPVRT
jgi:hypothetical protein